MIGLGLLAGCCRSVPRIPATGQLAGEKLVTTVDSELARYYLEDYLASRRLSAHQDRVIEAALDEAASGPIDRETFRRLSRRTSPDFAALYLVERLYSLPDNRRLQLAFRAHFDRWTAVGSDSPENFPASYRNCLLVFVPGYAWRMDPTTGADFARQRRLMERHGFQTLLIETHEIGTVEENAAIVAGALLQLAEDNDRVIVVSTSKAGPEVALALGESLRPEQSQHVRGWISIGGLLRGTPLADTWNRWPLSWAARLALPMQGYEPNVIPSLSTRTRTAAFDRLRFPPHLLMLQYVGVPLSGHIGPSTSRRYRAMRSLGPSDGLTLLPDEIVPGGHAITELGLDHFYRHPAIDLKALALALTMLGELERLEQEAQPATRGEAAARTPAIPGD